MVVLAVAAVIVTVGLLVACVVVLMAEVSALKEALEVAGRACGRERAAADVLRGELAHLEMTALLVTTWRREHKVGVS